MEKEKTKFFPSTDAFFEICKIIMIIIINGQNQRKILAKKDTSDLTSS